MVAGGAKKMNEKRLQVNFRLTLDEADKIEKKAKRAGLSLSRYCRDVAVHGRVVAPCLTPEMAKQILPLLGHMSKNLNQIARRMNGGGAAELKEFQVMTGDFQALWDMILSNRMPSRPHKKTEAAQMAAEPAAQPQGKRKKEKQGSAESRDGGALSWGAGIDISKNVW